MEFVDEEGWSRLVSWQGGGGGRGAGGGGK